MYWYPGTTPSVSWSYFFISFLVHYSALCGEHKREWNRIKIIDVVTSCHCLSVSGVGYNVSRVISVGSLASWSSADRKVCFRASWCPGRSGTELAENRWDNSPSRRASPNAAPAPSNRLSFTSNFLGFTIRGFLFIWSNYFASWLGGVLDAISAWVTTNFKLMVLFFSRFVELPQITWTRDLYNFPVPSVSPPRRQPSVALTTL